MYKILTKNQPYFSLSNFYQDRFGEKVHKISIDGGFNCPNIDGTIGKNGCIFCNIKSFSPSLHLNQSSISKQIDIGIQKLYQLYRIKKFIAYFQPSTNTYAPINILKAKYNEALRHNQIVGLTIGTRPDCISDELLDYFKEISKNFLFTLEIGLQSIKDKSLKWLRRGHSYKDFLNLVDRAHKKNIYIGVHIIIGLPGETKEDIINTAEELNKLNIHSVKIHNLYVVKNTDLETLYLNNQIRLISRSNYMDLLITFLEYLNPNIIIDRVCSDAPQDYLIAPDWCLQKQKFLQDLKKELQNKNSYQGKMRKS